VNLQSTRSEQSIIDHVHAIGHSDQEDVVELIHTVQFRQQLVDHAISNASSAASAATSLLADRVQLVEDNDVKTTLVPFLFVLLLRISEELSDIFFRLSDIFVQDFWAVDHFGFS
jgi:hypothetical protein